MITDFNRPGQPVRDFADYIDRTYPADIFPAPTAEEWAWLNAQATPRLAARIYSAAARKVAEIARSYADEIEADA